MKEVIDNQSFYWLLMEVMHRAKHRLQQIAETHDLTQLQSNTLVILKRDEPIAMNTLATYFMCDASNVTGIADRLEARGLIERQDYPKDRRIKMIALTDKGHELRTKIMNETIEAQDARLAPILTDEERETLTRILHKILDASN